MAIITKGVFTTIESTSIAPLTGPMGKTPVYRYCALAVHLKKLCALYNKFMATLCLSPQFIITGCETTDNTSRI
ncbi:hypothetical protein [Bartonella queenslandensis]|uniref:hypothetical protein n=1 Tax=Bartonella queenslandensis TaxID=481138 RepID=UPI001BAB60A4|nr:hypothetical protein [Bartonella queenslandensis]